MNEDSFKGANDFLNKIKEKLNSILEKVSCKESKKLPLIRLKVKSNLSTFVMNDIFKEFQNSYFMNKLANKKDFVQFEQISQEVKKQSVVSKSDGKDNEKDFINFFRNNVFK